MAAQRLGDIVGVQVTAQEQPEPLEIQALGGTGGVRPCPPTWGHPGGHTGTPPRPGGAARRSPRRGNPAAHPAPSCCCLGTEAAAGAAHACNPPTRGKPPTHACAGVYGVAAPPKKTGVPPKSLTVQVLLQLRKLLGAQGGPVGGDLHGGDTGTPPVLRVTRGRPHPPVSRHPPPGRHRRLRDFPGASSSPFSVSPIPSRPGPPTRGIPVHPVPPGTAQ